MTGWWTRALMTLTPSPRAAVLGKSAVLVGVTQIDLLTVLQTCGWGALLPAPLQHAAWLRVKATRDQCLENCGGLWLPEPVRCFRCRLLAGLQSSLLAASAEVGLPEA